MARPKERLSFLHHLFLSWPHCLLPLGGNSFKVPSLSSNSPPPFFFLFSFPEQVLMASLLHTSVDLWGPGSSQLMPAGKSNVAKLLWCHFSSLKPISLHLPSIPSPLITSCYAKVGNDGVRGGDQPSQDPFSGPKLLPPGIGC